MAVDVLMPQMGESVTEGTVTKWLKHEGDTVSRDEPLFEISTEKVDAEIPSPSAGVLLKIMVHEGQTVEVRSVVAQIEAGKGEAASAGAPSQPEAAAPKAAASGAPAEASASAPKQSAQARKEETSETRSSPLVRRLATENNIDLSQVSGTGPGGRITKEDVLAFIDSAKSQPAPAAKAPEQPKAPAPVSSGGVAGREEIVPMTTIRRKISEHMIMSQDTSAHVTTVFQVDLTRVSNIYSREKERFQRQENTRLGYTTFFIRAAIEALKRFPILNSSVSGDNIIYKKYINMGIAVSLDWGLIVPVIHNADEKSFLGLCRAMNDLADRARRKKLTVEEVQGGTFTITNPGALGSMFATPIISQPQVAILGVGGVQKMPVVVDDAIAIRPIVHLGLSYDHRVIDGYVADQFMAAVKSFLEKWEETIL